jgi:hypothetical protein
VSVGLLHEVADDSLVAYEPEGGRTAGGRGAVEGSGVPDRDDEIVESGVLCELV